MGVGYKQEINITKFKKMVLFIFNGLTVPSIKVDLGETKKQGLSSTMS